MIFSGIKLWNNRHFPAFPKYNPTTTPHDLDQSAKIAEVKPDINAAIHALGVYHEALRTRCETAYSTVKSFRTAAEEIESLFGDFGEIARTHKQQNTTLLEQEALIGQQAGALDAQAAQLRALQLSNAELGSKVENLSAARAAAESQLAVQEAHLQTMQAELKDHMAAARAHEQEAGAARAAAATQADEVARLSARLKESDKANIELAEERRTLRERMMFTNEEHMKLCKLHEDLTADARQKKRELSETQTELDKARRAGADLETKLAQSLADADALRQALHTSQAGHQDDKYSLTLQLDALKSRMRLTEQLLQKAREESRRTQDEQTAAEDLRRRLLRAEAQAEEMRATLDEKNKHIAGAEQARDAVIDRANKLLGKVREKQQLNELAAERIRVLQESLAALEAKSLEEAQSLRAQLAKLGDQLEKERTDRAYIEGALQIARRDRTQLQGIVTQNKSALAKHAPLSLVEVETAAQKETEELRDRLRASAPSGVEPLPTQTAAQ